MTKLVLGIVLGIIAIAMLRSSNGKPAIFKMGAQGILVAAVLFVLASAIITVPAGHIRVATLFGKVLDATYREGLHLVNPLLEFTQFDLRQKTHKESAGIPAEDKLITRMDVSVQYRTIGEMSPEILRNTGNTETLIQVHLIPKLRSILREQGKGVELSQDFFRESIQKQLQETLQLGLSEFLAPKGLQVETVLIRDVQLPDVIRTAITETKRREQEVLKQQAELERFAKEQEQKVKQAESELRAARLEAQRIKALAEAEAYKIDLINKTLAQSPNYIELKKVEQWNGVLPLYTGGDNIPMLDLRSMKKPVKKP
ncbi:MAG: prohibitin family protein [Enterobacterales bacterium]|nr:prohibitin family protein [Enterobacterales bacterium]